MWWVALWSLVAVFGTIGMVASASSVRFGRRVTREAAVLLTTATEASRIAHRAIGDVPAPVRRDLIKAVGRRKLGIRTVRLRDGGTFRQSLDGAWLPIRGSQYFTVSPPGFIWWGRVRVAPGLGRAVSGEFAFGPDDLPVTFTAERYAVNPPGGGSRGPGPIPASSVNLILTLIFARLP